MKKLLINWFWLLLILFVVFSVDNTRWIFFIILLSIGGIGIQIDKLFKLIEKIDSRVLDIPTKKDIEFENSKGGKLLNAIKGAFK